MKLTDEQKEGIDFWTEENMLVGDELTLAQIGLIRALRSSEQAWREEAEEAKRVTMEVSAALVESTIALNEIKEIIDSIPNGGSKEGRPDYGTVVSSDKVLRLRQLLNNSSIEKENNHV